MKAHGKRAWEDNLAYLGPEKREEVIELVDRFLDAVSVTTMGAPAGVRVERVTLHLNVAGVEVDTTLQCKGET